MYLKPEKRYPFQAELFCRGNDMEGGMGGGAQFTLEPVALHLDNNHFLPRVYVQCSSS